MVDRTGSVHLSLEEIKATRILQPLQDEKARVSFARVAHKIDMALTTLGQRLYDFPPAVPLCQFSLFLGQHELKTVWHYDCSKVFGQRHRPAVPRFHVLGSPGRETRGVAINSPLSVTSSLNRNLP